MARSCFLLGPFRGLPSAHYQSTCCTRWPVLGRRDDVAERPVLADGVPGVRRIRQQSPQEISGDVDAGVGQAHAHRLWWHPLRAGGRRSCQRRSGPEHPAFLWANQGQTLRLRPEAERAARGSAVSKLWKNAARSRRCEVEREPSSFIVSFVLSEFEHTLMLNHTEQMWDGASGDRLQLRQTRHLLGTSPLPPPRSTAATSFSTPTSYARAAPIVRLRCAFL